MIGFLFPGQGAEFVGMGKELYDSFDSAREVFDKVDERLNYSLSDIIFNGPIEELSKPSNAQPAIVAYSVALARVLENDFGYSIKDNVEIMAGHSLGEISALVVTGSLSIKDGAKIAHIRGKASEEAVHKGIAGMGAIIGLNIIDIYQIAMECSQGDVVQVSSYNCPGQVIISGHKPAVIRTLEKAKQLGAKAAILLNVDIPYHSSLMRPVGGAIEDLIEEMDIKFKKPSVPIVFAYNAKIEPNADKIKKRLAKGVYNQVLWKDVIEFMAKKKKVDTFIEIGPGTVLSALAKRIIPSADVKSIQTIKDIKALSKKQ